MANLNTSRVPQEASAEEIAQLIAALDRTSLALSQTSVTLSQDGTFTLHIPIGSFVVSTNRHGVAGAPTSGENSPQTVNVVADPTFNNVGPTPAEIIEGLGQHSDSGGKWYCVTRGLDVGVFKHLDEVTPLTLGVPNSAHKKHDTQALALEAYIRSWNNGHIRRF